MALVGLAGFALALALVEQIVLETNLANVSRGSRVYEAGHVSACCLGRGYEAVAGWLVQQGTSGADCFGVEAAGRVRTRIRQGCQLAAHTTDAAAAGGGVTHERGERTVFQL